MPSAAMARPIVSLGEAQAFVRIETGEEEALLAGLIRTASALCEAFINQAIIERPFSIDLPASAGWQRLEILPVRSIDRVEAMASDGSSELLPPEAHSVDVDSSGQGWVKIAAPASIRRVRVSGTAGMADHPNQVPEPIRQGVLRLVAHLFASRDGGGGEPPAAVTALWRPYRRMQLA
ncbi:MAG TPA: hypothetical protein VM265_07840 [Sphingomicrobium sp.]|nr:hypothetical protein [Sphingomicrobium sp.]